MAARSRLSYLPGWTHGPAIAAATAAFEGDLVDFEIARRHRYARDQASVPDDVEVHVLPSGEGTTPRWNSRAALRYRDVATARNRIAAAYRSSAEYLQARLDTGGRQ